MRRILLSSLVLLSACATPPPAQPPKVDLPAAWKETAPRFAEDGRWWRIYEDQELDKLVAEAFVKNTDLLIAAARVDEARALIADARGAQMPTVDARFGAQRQQNSKATATFFPGIPTQYSDYRAALNVSWEVDVFGRLRSAASAAAADFQASEAARDGVRLALAAQVAKAYFALRALDEQIAMTNRNVSLREDALGLQRRRFEGGVISEFDLRQLEAETAAVRAQLPPLQLARDQQEAALAVLLGRSPQQIYEAGVSRSAIFDQSLHPAVLPAGLPSELLLRRPDLVEAERHLAATNARIEAARAQMFPAITLTGIGGRESASLSNLFSGPAGLYLFAASVAQPIFAGGAHGARRPDALARELRGRVGARAGARPVAAPCAATLPERHREPARRNRRRTRPALRAHRAHRGAARSARRHCRSIQSAGRLVGGAVDDQFLVEAVPLVVVVDGFVRVDDSDRLTLLH